MQTLIWTKRTCIHSDRQVSQLTGGQREYLKIFWSKEQMYLQKQVHKQEVDLLNFKLKQMEEKFQAAQALNFNFACGGMNMNAPPLMFTPNAQQAQSQSLRLEYTSQTTPNQQS